MTTNAAQAIADEIDRVLNEMAECRRTEIASRRRRRLLKAQVEILQKVSLSLESGSATQVSTAQNGAVGGGARESYKGSPAAIQRPTEAILRLLKVSPAGLETTEIVDELEEKIESTSQNKRRLLQSLIQQLHKRGRLTMRGSRNVIIEPEEED